MTDCASECVSVWCERVMRGSGKSTEGNKRVMRRGGGAWSCGKAVATQTAGSVWYSKQQAQWETVLPCALQILLLCLFFAPLPGFEVLEDEGMHLCAPLRQSAQELNKHKEIELESLAFFRTTSSCKIRGQQIIYAILF